MSVDQQCIKHQQCILVSLSLELLKNFMLDNDLEDVKVSLEHVKLKPHGLIVFIIKFHYQLALDHHRHFKVIVIHPHK